MKLGLDHKSMYTLCIKKQIKCDRSSFRYKIFFSTQCMCKLVFSIKNAEITKKTKAIRYLKVLVTRPSLFSGGPFLEPQTLPFLGMPYKTVYGYTIIPNAKQTCG